MATIRQSANLKKRLAHLILAGGFIGTVVLTKLLGQDNEVQIIHFVPFMLGGLAMFAAQFLIRCQACGGNISPIVMNSGSPVAVSKQVGFCPYCGISVDTEISQCKDKFRRQESK